MIQSLKQRRELRKFSDAVNKLSSDKTKIFLRKNWFENQGHNSMKGLPKVTRKERVRQIEARRDVSTLKMNLKIPYKKMWQEAQNLKSQFVPHRKDPSFGWESLCLHGLGNHHTEHYTEYGYKSRPVDKFHWTPASKKCPIITAWLQECFPYSVYFRVRLMLLRPGGFISPHNDLGGDRRFAAINIALNQPEGCMMFMEGFGLVPWRAGDIRLMDIGINHCVVNLSKQDRYHIIVHGYPGDGRREAYEDILLNSV